MNRTATAPALPDRPKIESACYHVRPGYRVKASDAERIGRAILELTGDGQATPAQVVDAARDPSHPMHGDFEWDDRRAAEKQRIDRARYLIQSVEIVITYEGGDSESVRAFHSVVMEGEDGDARGFASSGTVFGRKELRAQIVEAARKELENWTARYGRYESLAAAARMVSAAIRKLEADRL